jgi:HEPN domain-containing protein
VFQRKSSSSHSNRSTKKPEADSVFKAPPRRNGEDITATSLYLQDQVVGATIRIEGFTLVTNLGTNPEDRNPPLILFNAAESYWQAAAALYEAKLRSTPATSPISFLYYHAIELYLKAFLRVHGHSAKELAGRNFGHRTCCLRERAEQLGLSFSDEEIQVLSLMSTTDAVIRSRYLKTGYYHWPSVEALERTCKSLRQTVGEALKEKGILVRM